jgi:SAM-dependent methyltransferase
VNGYVLTHDWNGERARLEALELVFDPGTIEILRTTGVGPGWRCLEVGGGAGSVARWLHDAVGPSGHVVVTDTETGFLEDLRCANLEVRCHDIVSDGLEEDAFDLIHCRAVLEHLADRDAVLERLGRALTPGGWLVVEDAGGIRGALVTGASDRRSVLGTRLFAVLLRLLAAGFSIVGHDGHFGRRLPVEFDRLGLVDVRALGRSVVIRGGSPEMEVWRLTLARVVSLVDSRSDRDGGPTPANRSLGQAVLRRVAGRAVAETDRFLSDPSVFLHLPVLVATVGRRPAPAGVPAGRR